MTLSLKNSNNKTSWLIYFRSVKFNYVKATDMMLVALVKAVEASQHKTQRKKMFSRLVEK